jgi:putative endonuclease
MRARRSQPADHAAGRGGEEPRRAAASGEEPRRAVGRRGEELAARYLAAAGYRVEARNLRTRGGELDLLVRRRRLWVAVEVKTRSLHPAPEVLVGDRALARLARALDELAAVLRPRPRLLRVDVVAVRCSAAGDELRHFPGAPFAPGASGGAVAADLFYQRRRAEL